MKKYRSLVIFLAGSLAGFLIGGFVKFGKNEVAEKSEAVASMKSSRPREQVRQRTAHERKWNTFGVKAKNFTAEDRKAFLKELQPQDRKAALAALFGESGPGGMDYFFLQMVQNILTRWMEDDFEGVWAWSTEAGNAATQRFVRAKLLDELVKKDPDRAFELYLEEAKNDKDYDASNSLVPSTVFDAKVAKGANEVLGMMSRFSFGSGSSGSEAKFPDDFDFQSLASGMLDLMGSRNNQKPPYFPSNFFESWAKLDPEAAQDWYLKMDNDRVIPFAGWDDVVRGVEKNLGAKEAAMWTADKIQAAGDTQRNMMVNQLMASPSEGFANGMTGIADVMPDVPSRDHFLTDAVKLDGFSYSQNRQGVLISELSSPEARLDAFRAMKSMGRMPDLSTLDDGQIQAWGITRQLLEAIREK